MLPTSGGKTNNNKQPISVKISDDGGSGINVSTLKFTLNYGGANHVFTSPDVRFFPGTCEALFDPATAGITLPDGVVTCTVDVSDEAGNAADSFSWSFTVDTAIPSFVSVEYFEDAAFSTPLNTYGGFSYARVGSIYLRITASEQLQEPPTVNIIRSDGNSAFDLPSSSVGGSVYRCLYSVPSDGYVGTANVTLWGRDSETLNAPAAPVAPASGGSFQIDTVAPSITALSYAVGASAASYEHLQAASVSITADFSEKLDTSLSSPVISIRRSDGTYIIDKAAMTRVTDSQWTATVDLTGEGDDYATVLISGCYDHAGNANGTVTIDTGTVHVDATAPVFYAISVDPAAASQVAGYDTIRITFRTNEPIDTSTLSVTVGGSATGAILASQGDTCFACEYAVTGAEAEGENAVVITGDDLAGNQGTAQASVIIDFTAPAVTVTPPTGDDFAVEWSWDDSTGSGVSPASATVELNGEDITAESLLTANGGRYSG